MMRQQHSPNLYEVLGICTDATTVEVRAAYHRAALRSHPDKGGNAEDFRLANRAFEVLSCPVSRGFYDSGDPHFPRQNPRSGTTTGCSATGGSVATTPARSRRKQTTSFPRQRAHMKTKTKKKKMQPLNTTVTAMHRLKVILQAMNANSRREVCTGMSQMMRKELARFMKDSSCKVSPNGPISCAFRPARHKPQPNVTGIRTCNRAHRKLYQAQMHIKALRLYARPQETLDSAIQHQILFSHLRLAMAAEEKADPNIWFNAKKMLQACEVVFKEMATSETYLGLRAFVHIRAQSWLGQSVQITSPSTTLCAALDAHARLLAARATSWELFRTEWIQLMVEKGRTLTEAEVVVDGARQTELQHQVVKALRGSEQALNQEQRRARTRATFCARTQAVDATEVVEEKTRPKRTRLSNVAFMGG